MKKPKLKLNQHQFESLYLLFARVVMLDTPADIAESLIMDLLEKVHHKLRKRYEYKFCKDGWNLTLEPEEAKAFYLYFQNRALPAGFTYESTLIQTQLNEINKLYA